MERPIRLRELPGIADIELKCKSRSYFDERNIATTLEQINSVSISLFSLSYWGTAYEDFDWSEDENPPTEDQWDTVLWNAIRPYDKVRGFWEALGWDLTDETGRELDCAHFFAEQIIILESGWVEDVRLTPDGSGALQPYDEPLGEEELAERLQREAAAFLLRQIERGR